MIDHVSIKVKDVEQAKAFYEAALAPLGYARGIEYPGGMQLLVEGEPGDVWVAPLPEGAEAVPTHVALRAADAAAVDAFYEAALAAGGTDNGAPGPRDYHPGYYAAFVYDPEGNNIEAVIHDWAE
ncbi:MULTISPECIES: VOC family protein [Eggerthella]|uniref:VOC family protein n=1 Tax=Eggerthella lenta TaxID=84112 RepID=A0A5C5BPD4_EGGLN|nr:MULTISPECIES: VOC family protein [Eggerthella]MCC2785058.1 VOC family protein [Eggerthella lenta]MCQ4798094.1 VOC family protein [Eggerthella lenta]MDB1777809.1 VOC family protein [Eggerthella lenta]MDB1799007.1 VOC family protein [Eggerthella lenta]MDU1387120.1 VOC family protein [Eggerthella sp.]